MLLLMKVSLLMSWRISGKFPVSRSYGHQPRAVNAVTLPRGSQLPVCPSTAHNRDLGRTALLRLALNPSKWFRKQWAAALFESRTARTARRWQEV